jgi:hypothetical protein
MLPFSSHSTTSSEPCRVVVGYTHECSPGPPGAGVTMKQFQQAACTWWGWGHVAPYMLTPAVHSSCGSAAPGMGCAGHLFKQLTSNTAPVAPRQPNRTTAVCAGWYMQDLVGCRCMKATLHVLPKPWITVCHPGANVLHNDQFLVESTELQGPLAARLAQAATLGLKERRYRAVECSHLR